MSRRLDRASEREDGKSPDETWAHYIKRRIGRENFNLYDSMSTSSKPNTLVLESGLDVGGYAIAVLEWLEIPDGTETLVGLRPFTAVAISRGADDKDIIDVNIYEDRVEIKECDSALIPPDVAGAIGCYREKDIPDFVEDLIAGIKSMLESGGRSGPAQVGL